MGDGVARVLARSWSGALVARSCVLLTGLLWISSGCGGDDKKSPGTLPTAGTSAAVGGGAAANGGSGGMSGTAGGGGSSGTSSAAADGGRSTSDDAGLADDDAGSTEPDAGKPRVHVPAPQPSGCIGDVTAGTHDLMCDGIGQHLTVGASCLTTQCGLIIDVHGGTMSAELEDKNTNLAALGSAHGYVVMQPSAVAGLWNYATDDSKVFAFAQLVIGVFHLDPKRVHMTGFSQGGYMTWRFICQHTDFLASAAPAAAAGMANISPETDCSLTGTDKPSGELDILYMHGEKDALVNFANALAKRDAVVALYGLDAGTKIAGDDTFTRTRYKNAKGTLFEFITHKYAATSLITVGHCYPGSRDQDPPAAGQLMSFGCVPPTSFTWGQEVLAFFMAHPKP